VNLEPQHLVSKALNGAVTSPTTPELLIHKRQVHSALISDLQ